MITAIGRMLSAGVNRAPTLISAAESFLRTGLPPRPDMRQELESYDSWVYACVSLIASRFAALKMNLVVDYGTYDEVEPVKSHPFLNLMKKPNPFMGRYEFMELFSIFYLLTGNVYVYVASDRFGIPRELWLLPPNKVWPVPHPDQFLVGYLYYPPGSSEPVRMGLNEIIHFKRPSPTSFYIGASPLKAAAYAYDINLYTHVYERSFFKEGARFDFALQTDADLTDDQIARTYAIWIKSHQGVEKAWRPAILSGGLKAVPLNAANKDFEFANLAKWTKDEILGIYKTPEAMLGHGEQVNRSSTDAFEVIFNRNAIEPEGLRFKEGVENNLLNRYPGQSDAARLCLYMESPVPPDREMVLKEEVEHVNNKIRSPNEIRTSRGWTKEKWGETPWGQVQDATLTNLLDNKPKDPNAVPVTPAAPTAPKPKKQLALDFEDGIDKFFDFLESYVAANVRSQFRDQEKRQLGLLKAVYEKDFASVTRDPSIVDRLLLAFENEVRIFVDGAVRIFASTAEIAIRTIVKAYGLTSEVSITDSKILSFIANKASVYADHVNRETRKVLRESLLEGIAAGETEVQLAGRVRGIFDLFRAERTTTIAQTEVSAIVNSVAMALYRKNDFSAKQWWTRQDERVRTTHNDAHGQLVGMSEKFHVGGAELDHPGDPSGPMKEIARCRCFVIPRRLV